MSGKARMHLPKTCAVILFTIVSWALGQSAPTSSPASQPASQAVCPPAASAPAAAAGAPQDAFTKAAKAIKNPVPWFSWGADERARNEYIMNKALNGTAAGHDTDYNRFRTRLWWTVKPLGFFDEKHADDLQLNFRLVWEFKDFFAPESTAHHVMDPNDALFDTLNITWKNVLGLPLKVVAGRQDIMLGNGWWMMDGTPDDGSRTFFFDGFRGTYEMKEIQTTVDAMYVWQNKFENQYIEPFNYRANRNQYLTEQNENAAVIYVTNKSLKDTELNAYFIYKNDSEPLTKGAIGDTGDIYAFGNRIVHDFSKNWQARGEWLEEVGKKNGGDFSAGGVNTKLIYFFRDKMDNQLHTGYEYLSDHYDPLWGRWPQWSELYPYITALDSRGRPAYYQNLHRINFGHTFTPVPKLDFCTDYHLLFADANPDAVQFDSTGRFRGQLLTFLTRYKFNDFFSTLFLVETFVPGDYYGPKHDDTAMFFRYELMFTF